MNVDSTGSCTEPLAGIRGVLFDIDGTLYRQRPVRAAMMRELADEAFRAPVRTLRVARVLRAFRRIRERLRHEHDTASVLAEEQYARCAVHAGGDAGDVRRIVEEWMMRRPLRYLAGARRPGIEGVLTMLAARGVKVGALSDYPVDAKLEALGVARHFSLRLCALDPAINAFKPHPAGFRRACALWEMDPQEVLYVGDRPEVDGAGAAAAGTQFAVVDDVTRPFAAR